MIPLAWMNWKSRVMAPGLVLIVASGPHTIRSGLPGREGPSAPLLFQGNPPAADSCGPPGPSGKSSQTTASSSREGADGSPGTRPEPKESRSSREGADGSPGTRPEPKESRPHEPQGYARFAENDGAEIPRFPRAHGGLSGCWWAYPPGNTRLTIVSDPSAPVSPPRVFQTKFPRGFRAGLGPVNLGGWDAAGPVKGQKREFYLSLWVEIVGADFENQKFGTKMGFLHWGPAQPRFISQGIWLLKNNRAVQGVESSWRMTFYQEFLGFPGMRNRILHQNRSPAALMTAGRWHHWEVVAVKNTVGQANGVFDWWIDGAQIMSYSDVVWVTPADTTGFTQWKWNPTWGGEGGVRTRDDYMLIDHVYLSGPPQTSVETSPR